MHDLVGNKISTKKEEIQYKCVYCERISSAMGFISTTGDNFCDMVCAHLYRTYETDGEKYEFDLEQFNDPLLKNKISKSSKRIYRELYNKYYFEIPVLEKKPTKLIDKKRASIRLRKILIRTKII